MVADFLTGLTKHWPTLAPEIHNRHYPYLVDELLGKLHCYSPTMQDILFTACRRRLHITDGPLGDTVQGLFKQDQRAHLNEHGRFRRVILSNNAEELKLNNALLISQYQNIVGEVKRQQDMLEQLQQRRQTEFHQQQAVQQRQTQQLQQQQQQQIFMAQMQMQGNLGGPGSYQSQQPAQLQQLQQPMQLSLNTNLQQVPQAQHVQQQLNGLPNLNTQWHQGQLQGELSRGV